MALIHSLFFLLLYTVCSRYVMTSSAFIALSTANTFSTAKEGPFYLRYYRSVQQWQVRAFGMDAILAATPSPTTAMYPDLGGTPVITRYAYVTFTY